MASRKSKVFALSLGRGLNMAVQVVFGMVVARVLSMHDLATYRQTMLAYNFAMPILTLGIPSAMYYFLSGAKSFVCSLHDRLPYFDRIGWDIGIDPKGKPIFIEFNLVPFVEGPQMAHGPMFCRYLDEVMDRIKVCRTRYKVKAEATFDHGFKRFDGIVRY